MIDIRATHSSVLRLLCFAAAFAGLTACGGGDSSGEQATSTTNPAPAPAPAPAPVGAVVYHFTDCQTGAAAGCVPGNNANAGTQTSPKRDLSSISVNALPAGSQLLFARGGAWNMPGRDVENLNTTASARLTFADYGAGAKPRFQATSFGTMFLHGNRQSQLNDGGYTYRNLHLRGMGNSGTDGHWGIYLGNNVHAVTIEGVEIENFDLGLHMQSTSLPGVVNLVVRDSHVHRNVVQGIHGKAYNATFENNLIERNNPSGSNRNHGMYLSGGNNLRIVNNRFLFNSVDSSGRCNGGQFTLHGQTDGLLFEGNLIEQSAAGGGCYGVSITAGYTESEWFRNATVRGNTVVNAGICAICASAAPGVVVEGNKLINTQATFQYGVQVPASGGGESPGDDPNGPAIVRNNTICQTAPQAGTGIVAPAGSTVTGNVLQSGAAATTGTCAR